MKSIIFDMDGTLFQTNMILEKSLEDTFHFLKSKKQWDQAAPIEKYREISIEQIPSLNKTELVKEITKKYNVDKGAVIGDRLSDINAAKDNGLVAIGCNFDFAKEDELSKADLVINDFKQLKRIFA